MHDVHSEDSRNNPENLESDVADSGESLGRGAHQFGGGTKTGAASISCTTAGGFCEKAHTHFINY
jgi:hypothetical protein